MLDYFFAYLVDLLRMLYVNSPLEQILDWGNEHTSRHLIASARQVLKGDSVFWLMHVFIIL
ncbi:hypothetical protein Hanom_Chr16g01503021 [Helianthus anomalus]